MTSSASRDLAILHICSARQAIYGAVQSLLTLAAAQRKAGKRVEFLTFAGKRFGGEVRSLGFVVHEVPVRMKIDPLAVLDMRGVIRRGLYDVVHTHLSTSSVIGCLAARLSRTPCVATVHGLSGKLSFAFADHLIGVSGQVKAHLVAQGVLADRITVVHNGLPMEVARFDRADIRRSLDLPANATVLGSVGRVIAAKGSFDAVRVVGALAASFPGLHYVAVGDGEGVEECIRWAGQLGISDRVRFPGYRADVDACLAAMDLFLFPSHKEAMGIALVEAMRSRLPVVAYGTGGIPEVVTPECGILVPPFDESALAAAVRALLSDRQRMHAMGEAGRARAVAEFSDSAMELATEAVYRERVIAVDGKA